MPKIVDHSERKSHIAEATWRVIMNQGMKGATVRNIAQEAGVSLGALRHYFTTQQELLAFAMNLVKERANARIEAVISLGLPPKELVTRALMEMLPLDESTMAEMEVWFAFIFHLRNAEGGHSGLNDGVYPGICKLVDHLDEQGLLRQGLDKDNEAERLYALVDGLALHAMLEPGRIDKQRIIRVLNSHMDSICRE
ncbi:TetR/AcrR family transcriptional regulator [Paenibacillus tianjinensis]|uniref:TetR/AcrR family transcriptional regulator n=1 Tax=Paenibacillus tianjinensis TaxID=2810347 RepID=A0ABX7LI59_9BACL|nr:TetR/AcrR family transcriptional regulator [Paenibacillus tianjinensis]QSF46876.1 TetR/AcrR family transcriptional regulator [Paenibacillus tianjinensis]